MLPRRDVRRERNQCSVRVHDERSRYLFKFLTLSVTTIHVDWHAQEDAHAAAAARVKSKALPVGRYCCWSTH